MEQIFVQSRIKNTKMMMIKTRDIVFLIHISFVLRDPISSEDDKSI
jgi:hypothetical protein